jgi:hypothetical protein
MPDEAEEIRLQAYHVPFPDQKGKVGTLPTKDTFYIGVWS